MRTKSLFCADIFRGNIRGPLIWQIAIGSEIDFRRNFGSRVQGPSRMSTVYALTYPPAVFFFPERQVRLLPSPSRNFRKTANFECNDGGGARYYSRVLELCVCGKRSGRVFVAETEVGNSEIMGGGGEEEGFCALPPSFLALLLLVHKTRRRSKSTHFFQKTSPTCSGKGFFSQKVFCYSSRPCYN